MIYDDLSVTKGTKKAKYFKISKNYSHFLKSSTIIIKLTLYNIQQVISRILFYIIKTMIYQTFNTSR